MPKNSCPAILLTLAAATLSGCASLPDTHGYRAMQTLVEAQLPIEPAWPTVAAGDRQITVPLVEDTPLTLERTLQLAFAYSPRVQQHYARIGLAQAELVGASRPSNPRFGISRLHSEHGSGTSTALSLSWGVFDLFLIPARKRLASAELERTIEHAAAALLDFAADVEIAWLESVSARQVLAMRRLTARAAEQSAALAQRFFEAGNISRLQLELERAAASLARIEVARAEAAEHKTRAGLANLLGVPSDQAWQPQEQLPTPRVLDLDLDALLSKAIEQRYDLRAAQRRVALLEDRLGVTRRWRWLGHIEAGYERESEAEGDRRRGPTLEFELPVFDQGQAALGRDQARLLDARARLDAQVLAVQNQIRLATERLRTAFEVAEAFRTALLPQREAIVARTQEEVNFMLAGVFDLIRVRQEEFDAYQQYLEAVRDSWIARVELQRALGGRLPDDQIDTQLVPTVGIEALLTPSSPTSRTEHTSGHRHEPSSRASDENDAPRTNHRAGHHHHQETPPEDADNSSSGPVQYPHGDSP